MPFEPLMTEGKGGVQYVFDRVLHRVIGCGN